MLKIWVPGKCATNTYFLLPMSEYAVVFATLDRKGRGTVSRDDVIRALQILQLNPTLEEVECLLQKYQQHGNNAQESIQKFLHVSFLYHKWVKKHYFSSRLFCDI